jgi:ABC-type branched-subunit amino acid transport system substrate-binding protein
MQAGPCGRYIFNIRSSYAQEAHATVELFKKRGVGNYKNVISFDQNDSFGQAGYDGLVAAYEKVIGKFPSSADPNTPIVRFRYTRNDDASVPAQANAMQAYLAQLLANQSGTQTVGIFMTDTYGAGTEFIKRVRDWHYGVTQTNNQATRLTIHFSNVSFVGPNALAEKLVALGTYFTPNGPKAYADTSDVVVKYNQLLKDAGKLPGFTSLEGYIAGRIFIAGLLRHQGPFTPDGLVTTFDTLPDLGLGLGASSGFSSTNHQYSQSVWGTMIQADGSFKNLYFWSKGVPISFYD